MMKVIVSLSYSEIFDGDLPDLKDLLKDISSELCLRILSHINAEIYLSEGIETQLRIFRALTERFPAELKKQILARISSKIPDNRIEFMGFFSFRFTLEFIHYELTNFRNLPVLDTTPEQEVNFLKAYFLIVERLHEKYDDTFRQHATVDADSFRKNTWPLLIDQFEADHAINPITGMVKGLTLFNYLQYHSQYAKYVERFLLATEKQTSWNYLFDLIGVISASWKLIKEQPDKPCPFVIGQAGFLTSLLEYFSLSVEQYQAEYSIGSKNFTGLKARPLYKVSTGDFIVLNWNFLSNKLYDGLVFDFYKSSGIGEVQEFKNFIDFKKYISENVVEKSLFRKLIQKYFSKKRSVVRFDDRRTQGDPDAYVRTGKYIFLIEIKDAYFPVKSVNSLSYKAIKDTIDQKYNGDKKGTGQIISQLNALKARSLEDKSFEELKLKRRNLNIYPIIIYTDISFNLPGINKYLADEFKKRIQLDQLSKEFGVIKDLTFINLSFLIDYILFFTQSKYDLKTVIDAYSSYLKKHESKVHSKRTRNNVFAVNNPFESFVKESLSVNKKDPQDYIKTIVEVLELTEGLPSNLSGQQAQKH